VIVDASVIVKWFVAEELRDEARQLVQLDEPLLAPDILVAELGNAMWAKARRNEVAYEDAIQAITVISSGRDLQFHASGPLILRAFELARELDHALYDCIYLALAESLDQPLVTADRRFVAAAEARYPRVRFLGQ
jgi:predicted nucleic acid-binding protein